jgi:hypothetical protein
LFAIAKHPADEAIPLAVQEIASHKPLAMTLPKIHAIDANRGG